MAAMLSIAGLRWILLTIGVLFLVGLALSETRRSRRQRAGRANEPVLPGTLPGQGDSPPEAPLRHRRYAEPSLGELPEGPQEPSAAVPFGASGGRTGLMTSPPVQFFSDPAVGETSYQGLDESLHGETDQLTGEPEAPQEQEDVELDVELDEEQDEEQEGGEDHSETTAGASHLSAPVNVSSPSPAPGPESLSITVPTGDQPAPLVVDWPPEGERQILSVRLVGRSERLLGRDARQALAACGFLHGRYRIFHQPVADGRVLLSCANLSKPGNFDLATMDSQRLAGLSLFTVLPGPLSARDAVERLLQTAQELSGRLLAQLQDDHGEPLDAAGLAALRRRAAELPATVAAGVEPAA